MEHSSGISVAGNSSIVPETSPTPIFKF